MSAEYAARDHAITFHWWRGNPDMSESETALRDLVALRDAAQDIIAEEAASAARIGALGTRTLRAITGYMTTIERTY